MPSDVVRVFKALCHHGLRMDWKELSPKEADYQQRIIRELLQDNNADTLIDAIRWGMPHVWPYTETEDGMPRVFSAEAVRKNLLEAKAAAAQFRRAGRTPYRPRGTNANLMA
jgi:hypothetical protein